MANDRKTDRRQFLQLMGLGAAASTLDSTIARALSIPAHYRTGTIKDVQHIVILMQENNSFDEYFGTLRGVRGFADPRAVRLATGDPVWLQPAGRYAAEGTPASQLGGVSLTPVIPPFRLNPAFATSVNAPSESGSISNLGLVYRADLDHGWTRTHAAWNGGQWDNWIDSKSPLTMSYQTREDIPYHYALADAFTVCDAYHCSIFSSTNPNRNYMWSGCIGNIPGNVLPDGTPTAQGTDGHGAGPVTGNGWPGSYPLSWPTFPEVLQQAGVSWKIYQDILGSPFSPDFGDGNVPGGVSVNGAFVGNYTDNSVLYFKQYAEASTSSPLFQRAATGTSLVSTVPAAGAPPQAWEEWAEGLFAQFGSDVRNGTLPQVSYIVAPAGYTEHPAYPSNYGAWYMSRVLDILVSSPEVFSKTVFLVTYDENDGFFDHLVAPTPPAAGDGSDGASTVGNDYEIVTTSNPPGPIGLGVRVPFLAISPWSKGGFVNSQVFDHTSIIRFIERRFDLPPFANISPWRRAVAGDLTSVFNFASPNGRPVELPNTDAYLPRELGGGQGSAFVPSSMSQVIPGVPAQERGVRPARALPYELEVRAVVTGGTVSLTFINRGMAAAVFHVRSANPQDPVRSYTVEAGRTLAGTWSVPGITYGLQVHGPNGFLRGFNGSIGTGAAALRVEAECRREESGALGLEVRNDTAQQATVRVVDAYTGQEVTRRFTRMGESLRHEWPLERFHGWYDLLVTVEEDPTFGFRLAGHVETGRDSYSDPAMGGLVALKA